MHKGVAYALLAAVLFGASTPLSKILVDQIAPVALAGLLYMGSGLGLLAWLIVGGLIGASFTACVPRQVTLTFCGGQ